MLDALTTQAPAVACDFATTTEQCFGAGASAEQVQVTGSNLLAVEIPNDATGQRVRALAEFFTDAARQRCTVTASD